MLLPDRGKGGGEGGGAESDAAAVALRLHPALRDHLRAAVYDLTPEATQQPPAHLQALVPTLAELEEVATERWEALLLFLVGASGPPPPAEGSECVPAPHRDAALALTWHSRRLDVPELLHAAGLMSTPAEVAAAAAASAMPGFEPAAPTAPAPSRGGAGALSVSAAGFRFLLLERASQLWLLLQHYLSAAEARGADAAAAVAFLLRLSFLPPHVPQRAPDAEARPAQRRMLADLATLGVLALFGDDDDRWFCPTPLAASLAAGLAAGGAGRPRDGHIIVETNYRVYAYTSSPLELAILRFFVRPEYRLPNVFVGALTRESVAGALTHGIGAEQIVAYLQQHAHPAVAGRTPAVPETVTDQIRLWAAGTLRLRASPATLYDDFPNADAYRAAAAHARTLGALLWADDAKRVFVARRDVQPQMREFFRIARERGAIT